MKIELDLTKILTDEFGNQTETLQESIARQVIEKITEEVRGDCEKEIKNAIAAVIREGLTEAVRQKMPVLIEDLMQAEYQEIDRYGNPKGGPKTLRTELIKTISENLVYDKKGYIQDCNFFTKAVDAAIEANVRTFKDQYNKLVDDNFSRQAMAYAIEKMKEKLGFK